VVAGLELVQRLVPSEKRQEHNDVAGFLYAVVGVVYAVLLALFVIAVWEQYQRANETVESEENALAEIAWLAHRLPEPEHHVLQEDACAYAQEVVDTEWPLMEQGLEGGVQHSGGVGPNRRYKGNPSRGRGGHGGRAGAICRRAGPD
jgi:hypothetical protein